MFLIDYLPTHTFQTAVVGNSATYPASHLLFSVDTYVSLSFSWVTNIRSGLRQWGQEAKLPCGHSSSNLYHFWMFHPRLDVFLHEVPMEGSFYTHKRCPHGMTKLLGDLDLSALPRLWTFTLDNSVIWPAFKLSWWGLRILSHKPLFIWAPGTFISTISLVSSIVRGLPVQHQEHKHLPPLMAAVVFPANPRSTKRCGKRGPLHSWSPAAHDTRWYCEFSE